GILDHVCSLLTPEAASRKIQIRTRLPTDIPLIPADSDQLTQAMLNLVINALQAVGQNGNVEVCASLAEDCVIIEVSDTGPGVPAERVNAIFEPYFTTKPGGTGIGLWIAQQIVLAHKGTIHVTNNHDGGARFTLRLPRSPIQPSHGTVQR